MMGAALQLLSNRLSPEEQLRAALYFVDQARRDLGSAPASIRDALELQFESLDQFEKGLRYDLREAIDAEGRECEDCAYCRRDDGYTTGKGLTDEPSRECGADAQRCPAVIELLGVPK